MDVHVQWDGVRAAAQHALHGARRACGRADLECPRPGRRARGDAAL